MIRLLALVALLPSALLSGAGRAAAPSDWPTRYGNAAQAAFNPGETSLRPAGLAPRFRLDGVTNYVVGGGRLFAFRQIRPGLSAPAAYNARTGALQHVYTAAAQSFPSEMAYGNGRLFVSGPAVTALDTVTGHVIWRTSVPNVSIGWHFPILAGNTLLVTVTRLNVDDVPYALDAPSGRILWSVHRTYSETPTVVRDRVFIPFSLLSRPAREDIVTYNLRTGRWLGRRTLPFDAIQDRWMATGNRLVLVGDITNSPLTMAMDLHNAIVWRNDHFRALATAYGLVFGLYVPHPVARGEMLGTNVGYPAALSLATNRLVWVNRNMGIRDEGVHGNAAVANGVFYYVDQARNAILAFDARSGGSLGASRPPTGYGIGSDMGIADGMLFVAGGRKGVLGSYDLFAFAP